MACNGIQTVEYESGQIGMFFGSEQELETYASLHNEQARKKNKFDYILTPAKDFLLSTPVTIPNTFAQRFKANVTAIKVLKELRNRNSSATRIEQVLLSQYYGWGSVSEVFDEANKKTESKRALLKKLLHESEYNSARSSTISAFYTPHYLVSAIYDMLDKVGFRQGRIFEPAAGIGNLISAMPNSMFENSKLSLVEIDDLSSEILEHLYPNATVFGGKGFEELDVKSNQDLVIQNPPFSKARVLDKQDKQLSGLSLHNYFLCKGVKCLRAGGLMLAIVSTSFMDVKNTKVRELVSQFAELKGKHLANTV